MCYAIGTGTIPTRSGLRIIKASVTRDQQTGSFRMWFQGWAPAMHTVRTAFVATLRPRAKCCGTSTEMHGSVYEVSECESLRGAQYPWRNEPLEVQ